MHLLLTLLAARAMGLVGKTLTTDFVIEKTDESRRVYFPEPTAVEVSWNVTCAPACKACFARICCGAVMWCANNDVAFSQRWGLSRDAIMRVSALHDGTVVHMELTTWNDPPWWAVIVAGVVAGAAALAALGASVGLLVVCACCVATERRRGFRPVN